MLGWCPWTVAVTAEVWRSCSLSFPFSFVRVGDCHLLKTWRTIRNHAFACHVAASLLVPPGDGLPTISSGCNYLGLLWWLRVKNLPANAGDTGSIPGLEDPTCHGAAKPVHHNCWACALEPGSCNYWRPCVPGAPQWKKLSEEAGTWLPESSSCSSQLEKSPRSNKDPVQSEKNYR